MYRKTDSFAEYKQDGKTERLGEHYKRYSPFSVTSSNTNSFSKNEYDTAFSEVNKNLSVKQESDITYENVENYLVVSSSDRDPEKYEVNNYIVDLQKELKNIYSIELIQAIIPNKNSVGDEPFLLLEVDEIEKPMISSDKTMSDAFAILPVSTKDTSNYIVVDKRIYENTIKYYQTPKASLSRMTMRIKDISGNLFDFGSGSEKELKNTFIFKVVTQEPKRDKLNVRNVY